MANEVATMSKKQQNDALLKEAEAIREKQLQTIAGFLMPIHAMLAAKMEAPEFVLNQGEAETIGDATVELMDAFDFDPDPRISASIGFVVALGTVYGGKYLAFRARKQEEQENEHAD